MAHEAHSESFVDSLHAALDSFALLPLAFVALLGFFVLATVVLEDSPRQAATVTEAPARA